MGRRLSPSITFDLVDRFGSGGDSSGSSGGGGGGGSSSSEGGGERGAGAEEVVSLIDPWAWPLLTQTAQQRSILLASASSSSARKHRDGSSDGSSDGSGDGSGDDIGGDSTAPVVIDVVALAKGDVCHVPKGCLFAVRSCGGTDCDAACSSGDGSSSNSVGSMRGGGSGKGGPIHNHNGHKLDHLMCGVATWHWMFLGGSSSETELRTSLAFAEEHRNRTRVLRLAQAGDHANNSNNASLVGGGGVPEQVRTTSCLNFV